MPSKGSPVDPRLEGSPWRAGELRRRCRHLAQVHAGLLRLQTRQPSAVSSVPLPAACASQPRLYPKRTECRWRLEQPSIAALKVHTSTGWPEQPDQFSMGISTIVLADGVGRRRADLSPPSGVCGVRPSRSTIIVALTMFLVRRRGRRYPNSLGRRGS